MRPRLPRDQVRRRLQLIFPRPGFDAASSNPAAAAAVATMLFIDAVAPDEAGLPNEMHWLRPSMVQWMSDELHAVEDADAREAWYAAAKRSRASAEQVERQLG